jgi:hypothetical protein
VYNNDDDDDDGDDNGNNIKEDTVDCKPGEDKTTGRALVAELLPIRKV